MSNEVRSVFTATIDDYAQKLAKMEQMNERLINQNKGLRNEHEKSHNAIAGWGNSQLATLSSMAAGYLSVATAIRVVGDAYAYQREQAEKAKNTAVSVGDAQSMVIRNLVGANRQQREEYLGAIEKVAAEAPVKGGVVTTMQMTAAALSSFQGKGGQALEAVRIASKLAPDSPEMAEEIARGIGFVRNATKSDSVAQNAGFLIQMAAMSPSKSIGDTATNVAGKLSGIMGTGATPQFAAALTMAIAQASGDVHMKRSVTAAISLGEQLQAMLPEEDLHDKDSKGRRIVKRKGTGLKTIEERMAWLREHPEEAEEIVGSMAEKLSLQKGATGPIRQLLTGRESPTGPNLGLNTAAGRVLTDVLAGIKPVEQSGAFTEDLVGALGDTFEQKGAGFERTKAISLEKLRSTLLGKQAAMRGFLSKGAMKDQMQAAGADWFEATGESFAWTADQLMSGDAVERWRKAGERQAHRLRFDQATHFMGGEFQYTEEKTTDSARLQAANTLEGLIAEQVKQAKAMQAELVRLREVAEKEAQKPSPAAIQNNIPIHREAPPRPAGYNGPA